MRKSDGLGGLKRDGGITVELVVKVVTDGRYVISRPFPFPSLDRLLSSDLVTFIPCISTPVSGVRTSSSLI